MFGRYTAVFAFAALAAQPVLAAQVLGEGSIYTSGQTSLSGAGSYGSIAAGSFTKSGAPSYTLQSLTPAELGAAMDNAAAVSSYYAGLDSTDFSITGSTLNGVSGVNIIDLSGAALAGLTSFNAADATSVIFNISGSFSGSGNFNIFPGLDAGNVLFNFYDAAGVTMSGSGTLGGTILAPGALVSLSGSSTVLGSVYADSFKGSGNNKVGGAGFVAPDFGNTVPEPASWVLLIAGFGMIGACVRRRRRSSVVTA